MKTKKNYYKTNTSHYGKCRSLMLRLRNFHRIRCLLTGIAIFANCYFHVIALPIFYYSEVDRLYGLFWGLFAYAINLIIVLTAFFATEKNQRLLTMLLILITVATVIGFLHLHAGILLGIVFLTQIPDCMKMKWLEKQQGYPYFNERYQLQQDYKKFIYEDSFGKSTATRNQEIVVFSMPEEHKK